MYEISRLQFFETINGIKSWPDTLEESEPIITVSYDCMIYLELEVLEILCSFRLVLEGKAGRERP